jgi:hypothetical protein
MSHSADADDFILAQWRDVLADAGVAESEYHLITCPGAPTPENPKAVSFARDYAVTAGPIVSTPAKLAEAAQHAAVNRVATFEDWDEDNAVDVARLAGLLRHEIEHGIQRDMCANSFALYDLTDAIIRHAIQDGHNYRELFHLQPVEWDADAAASTFLHSHQVHRAVVSDLLEGVDTYLVRSQLAPGDPTALVARTVAFLYSFRDACLKQEQREPIGFAELLDLMAPGAANLWLALEAASLC